jgi:hypothetical protein
MGGEERGSVDRGESLGVSLPEFSEITEHLRTGNVLKRENVSGSVDSLRENVGAPLFKRGAVLHLLHDEGELRGESIVN